MLISIILLEGSSLPKSKWKTSRN